ncbi:hypothetical protein [Actinomyces urogenitalis]|uniref:hypothetical protein n=1 Tax=Actinomyces urogenitalis TaxID=103621 RepID=UPI002550D17E|nr:hypothetical protein [Actinomyces urogenitalis]MDK8237455.1 hypothetical protein [Actinomyces urogenitalis]WOO94252.1 hypothetical protein R3I39_05895 [Actinomyces urogenitalis]
MAEVAMVSRRWWQGKDEYTGQDDALPVSLLLVRQPSVGVPLLCALRRDLMAMKKN